MDKRVRIMGIIRITYGLLGLLGGLLIYYLNDLKQALLINGILGSVGPFVFICVSALGISAVCSKVNRRKLVFLAVGMFLVLAATR